jgi:tRNA pseudouridine55 synthase
MILVINKEKNITSRDVVNKLNKILNTKKIGHTGTLDPLATGVLVCLTDKHTKLVDVITSEEKEYIAEIKLGIETDTLDITGNIINENNNINLDINNIKNVLKSFVGKYIEEVPKYSAVKINGKKLYQYARNNVDIELPKREVEIKEIELLDYHDDIIKFKCLVSKGTYIRSLIKDICNKLNVLGTMNSLIRTKQGRFTIDSSYTLDDVKNNNYRDIPIDNVLDVKYIELDDNLYKKVINGNRLNLDYNGYILFTKDNKQVALYNFINKEGKLIILF